MSKYIIYDGRFYDADELMHYGVKGMKWGVRRYVDTNGRLTAEGKKRAKQEYKQDNKTAFELGRSATISGHAAAKSMRRTIKIENKLDKQYAKDPEGAKRRTKSLRKKWDASSKTTMKLTKEYLARKDKAEKHCQSLIDKYGKEAVSSIKYKDVKLPKGQYSPKSFRTMNERTNNLASYGQAGSRAVLAGGVLSLLMQRPIYAIGLPSSTNQKASSYESRTYREERRRSR